MTWNTNMDEAPRDGDYGLVLSGDHQQFVRMVNTALKDGAQLIGGVSISRGPVKVQYAQAVFIPSPLETNHDPE